VAFHDAPELDGCVVMTAEFVEGTTLAELCRPGPLLSSEAMRVICDVLSGLEEAHALGIVHRGITAEHVMVTPEGEVKLGGFDLAKPEADVMLTKGGAVLGDPRYISPEQVMGVEALDGRADVYSVGVLLFQTLTGKVPFDGPNDYDIMVAQVRQAAAAAQFAESGDCAGTGADRAHRACQGTRETLCRGEGVPHGARRRWNAPWRRRRRRRRRRCRKSWPAFLVQAEAAGLGGLRGCSA
jgi:serine/threonine protein kinase